MDALPNKDKKNGCLFLFNSASLLLSCLTSFLSFICLSKGWFLSDPVAIDSAGVGGRTYVQCKYYGMLRKERARWSACSLWCHTRVCKSLCVFNAFWIFLLFSCKEQEATWRDGHQTQTLIGWDVPWTLSDHRHVFKPLVHFCWTIRSLISYRTKASSTNIIVSASTWHKMNQHLYVVLNIQLRATETIFFFKYWRLNVRTSVWVGKTHWQRLSYPSPLSFTFPWFCMIKDCISNWRVGFPLTLTCAKRRRQERPEKTADELKTQDYMAEIYQTYSSKAFQPWQLWPTHILQLWLWLYQLQTAAFC